MARWSRAIPLAALEAELGLPGPLTSIRWSTDRFDRPLEAHLSGDGWERTISSLRLREAWNRAVQDRAQRLPSPFLRRVTVTNRILEVEGSGFGHGAGLCQYGAAGLAAKGRTYREILRTYYAGASLDHRW